MVLYGYLKLFSGMIKPYKNHVELRLIYPSKVQEKTRIWMFSPHICSKANYLFA